MAVITCSRFKAREKQAGVDVQVDYAMLINVFAFTDGIHTERCVLLQKRLYNSPCEGP